MINITLDTDKIMHALGVLGDDFKKALSIGLKKSALVIEGHAKELAPVDTGVMRNTIFTFFDGGMFSGGKALSSGYGGDTYTAEIIPMTKYAVYVELNENARHPTGQAHFMRDGAKKSEGDITNIFENELSKAVNKFNR